MRTRIRWADGVWGLLVVLAAALMSCGLAMTFSIIDLVDLLSSSGPQRGRGQDRQLSRWG